LGTDSLPALLELRGTERVREFLARNVPEAKVVELDGSTRTSALAAGALGCALAEIAKSIVFAGAAAAVVVISGDKRVDGKKLRAVTGDNHRIASPQEVLESTGYIIGGVPPFPHRPQVKVYLDASLGRFQSVWAAAGAPNSVMQLSTASLLEAVGSEFVDLA